MLFRSSEEFPKEILPPEPKEVKEIVEQEPASPNTPGTPSVVEDSTDISTSPDFESHEEKGPSSRIKLNHSPEGSLHKIILLDFDPFLYKSMIGSLLYLTASRLDISYSMRVYARYQANPKESHMIALKRIIKYVCRGLFWWDWAASCDDGP